MAAVVYSIDYWNARPIEDALQRERDELRAVCVTALTAIDFLVENGSISYRELDNAGINTFANKLRSMKNDLEKKR